MKDTLQARVRAHFTGAGDMPSILGTLCRQLVDEQRESWPGYRGACASLGDTRERDIECSGFSVRLMYNPGRSVNTLATVTPDEISDPQNLRLYSKVNGRILQDGNTSAMIFKIARLISFISASITLEPGDIIATGTPGGIGSAHSPPVLLKPGDGVETGRHASAIFGGSVGVLHGMRTYILQDDDGQTKESHSISAGLDYPGVGPEHSWLATTGRAHYEPVTDAEAMEAFRLVTQLEGIMPAIESAHGIAGALRLGRRLAVEQPDLEPLICVCLSGRGDKDVPTALSWFGLDGTPNETVGGF